MSQRLIKSPTSNKIVASSVYRCRCGQPHRSAVVGKCRPGKESSGSSNSRSAIQDLHYLNLDIATTNRRLGRPHYLNCDIFRFYSNPSFNTCLWFNNSWEHWSCLVITIEYLSASILITFLPILLSIVEYWLKVFCIKCHVCY